MTEGVSILQIIALGLVAAAALLGTLRLVLGPTLPDRVIAADTVGVITIAVIAAVALWTGNGLYLDVALVYGALSFVGVVAIARAVERREGEE